jgi:hypothetical protein
MIIINTVNSQRFSLDGIEYFKNFISKVFGNKIKIYNAYDSNDVLVDVEIYSNIQLNGVIYANATLLQQALLSVIYSRDSLNGLLQTSGYFNRFTNNTGFTLISDNLTINAGWAWEIQGTPYGNPSNVVINIPYSAVGYHRIDLIIATTTNTFIRIAGNEVLLANLPAEPAPTPNTLRYTAIIVNSASYGDVVVSNTDTTASHYKGDYNITTNTPTLVNGTGQLGDEYKCTVAGTRDFGSGNITVGINDILAYSGSVWFKKVNNNQAGASTTDSLPEGVTNLYFTTARVLATVLTGISFATGGAIVSTDTVLQAFGKIQKQINDLTSVYQAILVSGTNIKTLNGNSLLGSGDLVSLVTNSTVTGTYNLDFSKDTFELILTGNTTFSVSNLPTGTTKVISVYVTGNYAITYPSGFTTRILGAYDGTKNNQIIIEYRGTTNAYWVTINQAL